MAGSRRASGGETVRLFHGTIKDTAEAIVAGGFQLPNIEARLRGLAEQYGVEFEALKDDEGMGFVWIREAHDRGSAVPRTPLVRDFPLKIPPGIYFATNPRLAASYARRGSEIDYFGRAAIYRPQHPTADRKDRSWHRAAEEWAKAEVARAQRPALVEIAVPRHELPHEALEAIVRAEALPPEFQYLFNGDTVALTPAFASNWIVGMQLVDPCTCWRDGKPCSACRDFTERPGGWNGTF